MTERPTDRQTQTVGFEDNVRVLADTFDLQQKDFKKKQEVLDPRQYGKSYFWFDNIRSFIIKQNLAILDVPISIAVGFKPIMGFLVV